MRPRHALIPVIALAIAGMASPAWAAADPAAAPPWRTVPPPKAPAGADVNLLGVSMTGPSDGWAAGFALTDHFRPYTAHWDGHRWTAVAVPKAARGRLNGVVALSKSNAWAVGDSPNGTTSPTILHWTGQSWVQVKSAPVPHEDMASLQSVAAVSARDVWAVGEAENDTTEHFRTVIEHWNGSRWSLVASPNLGQVSFLLSVTATSNGSVWAVGGADNRTGPFIVRLSKGKWVKAPVPKTPANTDIDLDSITAVSPTQLWAVGDISVNNTPSRPYSLRWNGHKWSAVKVPDPKAGDADHRMLSVTAFGHGQLVAVGYTQGPAPLGPVYSRWNGKRWSVVLGPRTSDDVESVASDGKNLWAVGTTGTNRLLPILQESH
jgi:hypothetical protein